MIFHYRKKGFWKEKRKIDVNEGIVKVVSGEKREKFKGLKGME